MEGVVKCHHSSWDQVTREAVEVQLCAAIGMISIDPQQADGRIPTCHQVAGKGTAHIDEIGDAGRLNIVDEVLVGLSII